MYEKERGVVLKHFLPSQHKIAVLTQNLGKIVLVILDIRQAQRVRAGCVIDFIVKDQQESLYTTQHVEIMAIPLAVKPSDMYWLHHMLELCYYFLPLQEEAGDQFFLLSACLVLIDSPVPYLDGWEMIKRLCIATFLMLLGFYPPEQLKISLKTFQKALFMFVDFDDRQKVEFLKIHLEDISNVHLVELDAWLIECIQSHPRISAFKTLNFIYQSPSPFK